jgi:hypothetical protein
MVEFYQNNSKVRADLEKRKCAREATSGRRSCIPWTSAFSLSLSLSLSLSVKMSRSPIIPFPYSPSLFSSATFYRLSLAETHGTGLTQKKKTHTHRHRHTHTHRRLLSSFMSVSWGPQRSRKKFGSTSEGTSILLLIIKIEVLEPTKNQELSSDRIAIGSYTQWKKVNSFFEP